MSEKGVLRIIYDYIIGVTCFSFHPLKIELLFVDKPLVVSGNS